jgi:hypothetical protein
MCRSEETVIDSVRINVSEWRDCCWLSQNKCVGVKSDWVNNSLFTPTHLFWRSQQQSRHSETFILTESTTVSSLRDIYSDWVNNSLFTPTHLFWLSQQQSLHSDTFILTESTTVSSLRHIYSDGFNRNCHKSHWPLHKNTSETNTFNETSDSRTTIPVYFPRSMCNPTSLDFKVVVKTTKRISRFYIGSIDESCSSEESMRKFLLDRNIPVIFLRYFIVHQEELRLLN